jgi:tellurite methyltransferase
MAAELIDFTKPQSYVAAVLRYVKGGSMLDLGAGWGRNARFFADHHFDVTAVDNAPEAVEQLKNYRSPSGKSIHAVCADIRHFRSEDVYDVVLCTMVLHYLDSAVEVTAALARIKTMTKPGGLNVVSMYSNRNPRGLRPYLARPDELADYYLGWDVIDAYEGLGRRFKPQSSGPPVRHYSSRITARRRADAPASSGDTMPAARTISANRTTRKAGP